MQARHTDRQRYFAELAQTSEKHIVPYLRQFCRLGVGTRVLELGCGDGGNLLPLARMGCRVTGVDLSVARIDEAQRCFCQNKAEGVFVVADITRPVVGLEGKFDVILCHDVVEHVADKRALLHRMAALLERGGRVFVAFPAWQMPFGGHQQICHSRVLSHAPWIHLLPLRLYRGLLLRHGEPEGCVRELLAIRRTRITVEGFERLVCGSGLSISHRRLWFINPHYEVKFGLRPRRLWPFLERIPYLRDFMATSCFYMLRLD